jgi:Flp pilus assembly protein TadD
MPKHVAPKLVKIGGEGTSHRILRTQDEPIPSMHTPQTSVDPTTGLILIDSDSADHQAKLPRAVLLKAFQSVLAHNQERDDLKTRYQALLDEMSKDPEDAFVFGALAESELAKRTPEGNAQAVLDLQEAVRLGTNSPRDYMLLSELQYRAKNFHDAIAALSTALTKFPYLPTPYENLAVCYMRLGEAQKAADMVRRGLAIFPADQNLILLAGRIHM